MNRLLIVSNRLPVTAHFGEGRLTVTPSAGGLATGMRGPHERSGGLWIGWPGDLPRLPAAQHTELRAALADVRAVPVELNRREVRAFYEDVSNGVLWPLLHYQVGQLPSNLRGWDTFVEVNRKFARVVAECYEPGDLVWVHDYQLMLVPAMVREQVPEARIGFFLHTPFPSSEVFTVLPWREALLRGMLGADLIGFHTAGYMRHFATSVQRVLGIAADIDRVTYNSRDVHVGVFPMGIDTPHWSALGADPDVAREVEQIRADAGGRKILLGIDRLDYTKGLLRRLLAIERLLQTEPEMRERLRIIQVTVPSRERVEAYAGLRRRIDELIGRINSAYATPGSVPIHNLHRSVAEHELSALYQAADVMLVTPLRDGMNLVAKEFIASRRDEDGVLVLSEFAGAATELGDALHVNPYNVDGMAATIREALDMPREERRARMSAMRQRVAEHDVHRWASSFIDRLREVAPGRRAIEEAHSDLAELTRFLARVRADRDFVLIVDYDGTLVPFAPTPDAAVPDAGALELLGRLAARPRTRVHVVTGRTRESIEAWLGYLPIGLHAEHGLWSRMPGASCWKRLDGQPLEWMDHVRPIMEHFTSLTPGALVEQKSASLAWHYRAAAHQDGDSFGEYQARELRLVLSEMLSNAPVEVIAGNKVVEVRSQGVNKGKVVPLILAAARGDETILAIGDDRTDEDLFAALPDGSLTVKVGEGPSMALYRLLGTEEVRRLLAALLE